MNVLEVNNLSFSYPDAGGRKGPSVLKQLSFYIAEGESVGLIGANGVGKSTLLKLLCGLLDIQEGDVVIAGLPLCKKNLNPIREKVGYVFQDSDSQLFMPSVFEEVAFGLRNYGRSREDVEEVVMEALRQVHMDQSKDKRIYQLSGGEKKLVSIATVLAMPYRLMLLDEPSVGLDPRNRRNLIGILNQLPEAKLIASHDLDLIRDTCSRVILLSYDGIAGAGPSQAVLEDRELLERHGL